MDRVFILKKILVSYCLLFYISHCFADTDRIGNVFNTLQKHTSMSVSNGEVVIEKVERADNTIIITFRYVNYSANELREFRKLNDVITQGNDQVCNNDVLKQIIMSDNAILKYNLYSKDKELVSSFEISKDSCVKPNQTKNFDQYVRDFFERENENLPAVDEDVRIEKIIVKGKTIIMTYTFLEADTNTLKLLLSKDTLKEIEDETCNRSSVPYFLGKGMLVKLNLNSANDTTVKSIYLTKKYCSQYKLIR